VTSITLVKDITGAFCCFINVAYEQMLFFCDSITGIIYFLHCELEIA